MNSRAAARPEYGVDAPGLVRALFATGFAAILLGSAAALSPWPGPPWGVGLAIACGCVAVYGFGLAGFMVYSSTVGKVRGRERLLNLIPWTGGEVVLDVGCGRGLMAVGAAKRLTTGKAVGIDVWQAEDQSGNRPDAAVENARREGVADRVEIQTCDMRRLDHPDATFDVVVSHWAVHNLYAEADRLAAMREMVRVLKPGGTIILADITHHAEYARLLTACGLTEVREVENGWRTTLAAVISFGNFRPAAVVGTNGSSERG